MPYRPETRNPGFMKKRCMRIRSFAILSFFLETARLLAGAPPPAAASAFDTYNDALAARFTQQHSFVQPPDGPENLTPSDGADFHGASLSHWRGTAFAPGATAAGFERLLRDIASYPRYFAPHVIQAKVLTASGDRMQASMRVRERYAITVVLDTSYDITFGRLDAKRGYSISRSTRIAEIDKPGASSERVLKDDEEHGFLWRLNTYWSYVETESGLNMQIETVSLSRAIPRGLGWAIRPYVDRIPRESLEFTLRSVRKALLMERTGK